jgi:hypothetical protein
MKIKSAKKVISSYQDTKQTTKVNEIAYIHFINTIIPFWKEYAKPIFINDSLGFL